ncbi:bifunctional folylpolyglutamate synthase/dihydrofolate synthase [Chryseobacterium jejuense]|uniref:Dihydrofolate synthase/folylpolyglutamate synthase n=1 Tax=Chryseobacterium jejuense TaxID=445960 RepID=A0A2X2X9M1_CHRJE|nr:folylpolyglutamate synthase/dihydrofolate synthase family protein [Chryseobacterium jejuense]SDI66296.1 dihydrofolate synthase / folylpolyglutamate synthase [Chryseobacterium jejuense]SQB47381.1 Folylpolyglutamate synthase [Chryseobacterium jejuense]
MTNEQYQEAIDWLFVQMPNYQIDGQKAYKPGLDNIIKLCAYFGNPQEKIKCIHVGGTNGKGSSSNMLSSILQEAGYKVGLYNSPHLIDFTERIKVDGKNCHKEFVFDFIQKLKNIPEDIKPSFFEFTTIMAFEYFYQQQVDFAIIEVGLGGRLDSTNIIKPLVSAITNVQLDHQNILGDTIEEIAAEKAGIIKKNIPIISGDENEIVKAMITEKAMKEDAPFIDATLLHSDLSSDLKGNYQKKNIRVVLAIVQELRKQDINITDIDLKNGLLNVHQNTGFIGRWFEFSQNPLTICDTGHNQAGLEYVFSQLNSIYRHKHVILGFVNDKKIDEVMNLLPENSEFYFAKPSINRGRHPEDYENLLQEAKIFYKIFNSVQDAYLSAKERCTNEEMIFIGGSNFVVGDFLEKNLKFKE